MSTSVKLGITEGHLDMCKNTNGTAPLEFIFVTVRLGYCRLGSAAARVAWAGKRTSVRMRAYSTLAAAKLFQPYQIGWAFSPIQRLSAV